MNFMKILHPDIPIKLKLAARIWIFISLLLIFQSHAKSINWGKSALKQQPEWYASTTAQATADNVLIYQSKFGAWPKNWDLTATITVEALETLNKGGKANTIDNGATVTPMRFLALVYQFNPDEKYRTAFNFGVNYLLDSQYSNGGFPQFFPLRGDTYYSRITYNDGAMINALEMIRDVAKSQAPYDLADKKLHARAMTSVESGISCILRTQIKRDGKLTAWCAQHDEETLDPAWARSYEPPSISGAESVGIVRFLMSIEEPTPEIISAVKGAIFWFKDVAIHGIHIEEFIDDSGKKDRRVVASSDDNPIWARFYEIGSNRPIFVDRDSVIRYSFAELGQERRNGYSYYGRWATNLVSYEYQQWSEKHNLPE